MHAPITTCSVERSFWAYKDILSDRGLNFSPEHIEWLLVIHSLNSDKDK